MAPTTRSTDTKEGNKTEAQNNEPTVNPDNTDKGKVNATLSIPKPIDKLGIDIQNQATPQSIQSRLVIMIGQMNKLTDTVNTLTTQFHAVRVEISQINEQVVITQKNQAGI